MSYKEYFFRKVMPTYFMLVTFLVVFIWLCGTILEPEARFGYDVLLSPLIYGGIGVIPSILGYSRKEYTVRQAFIKNLLEFLLLLVLVMGFSVSMHVIKSWQEGVAIFLGVCVIYALIAWIQWKMELRTASALTEALKKLKDEEE